MAVEGKKAVLIIARENFRDEELFEPKEALESAGVDVTVASSSLGTATGMMGATANPDMLIEDISVSDYDAVVFIGGTGASEYFESPVAHSIAREAAKSGKLLAAICIAPSTLANAGLLEGKKATCFSSQEGNLRSNGAEFTGASVEKDGNILTGEGPSSAQKFGKALLEALE